MWCKSVLLATQKEGITRHLSNQLLSSFSEKENERWLGLLNHLCLRHMCTKSEFSSLLRRVIPVKHIQVLLGSLPNTGCTAIKPHFTAFNTIISDEGFFSGAVTPLSLATSKAPLSSFEESHPWTPFDGACVACNLTQCHLSLAGCSMKKRPPDSWERGYFQEECLLIYVFWLSNNAGRWTSGTVLTRAGGRRDMGYDTL